MIGVVDYGLGNVGALITMLAKLGHPAHLASTPQAVAGSSGLILPGVGAFDHAVTLLAQTGLRPALEDFHADGAGPILGICLGMQLLGRGSDEGQLPGLGWLDVWTSAFSADPAVTGRLKIPHMGWSAVQIVRPGTLFAGWQGDARFYFVHSYRVSDAPGELVLARGWHGSPFVAALAQGRVSGVQFHPEKSHRYGMALLDNFARSTGAS